MGSTQSTWGLTSLHLCSSVLNSSSNRTRRHHNSFDKMVKLLVAIVLVLAVGALAKPQRDEGIKKTIEAQKMAAKAAEAPTPVVTEEPVVVEKPVVAEPVVAEPVAAEPAATESVVAEPVAAEPVVAEPVAAEPVAAEPVAAEPVAVEPVNVEPVVAEQVVEEKPVVAEPAVEEKPAVVEEPVVAEKPVEKTKLEGHLDCLKEAKWAPAQLLNCGKKIF